MRYGDFYDYEPEPKHPALSERPRDIASLFVYKAEWADFTRIRKEHEPAEIVDVKKVPIIDAFDIGVLCQNADAAMTLMIAWGEYCETSPHRPHSKEEALARAERNGSGLNIPRDWTF